MMPMLGIKWLRCLKISCLVSNSTPTAGVWLVKSNSGHDVMYILYSKFLNHIIMSSNARGSTLKGHSLSSISELGPCFSDL